MGFSKLAFNHERHSRFRPGEAHADVACAACHDSVFRDDVEIVRYVPLPTECVDCHGDHVEPLRKRKGDRR